MLRTVLAVVMLAPTVAQAQTTAISVAWDHSPDPAAIGYTIYVGTQPGVYGLTSMDLGKVTSTIVNVTGPGTYYFALKSYDINGKRGEFSNEVSKTIAAPLTTSANGTTIPTASSIVDCAGARWTVVSRIVFRNNVDTGGRVDLLLFHDCGIYGKVESDASWWQFTAGTWGRIAGDPRPTTIPSDTEAPSISLSVGRRTGNTYPVTVIATDNVAVDHVEVYVDNVLQAYMTVPTTIATAEYKARITIKAGGSHVVIAKAVDTAKLESVAVATVKR